MPLTTVSVPYVLTRDLRDKRIAVARDVLAQLVREGLPLCVETGSYVATYEYFDRAYIFGPDDQLQAHVDAVQAHCTVCLLGACLLSQARLYDQITVASVRYKSDPVFGHIFEVHGDAGKAALADIFDRDTMNSMECAFERDRLGNPPCDEIFNAITFGYRFDTHKDRVAAVMNNLIANDGEFLLLEESEDEE